LLIRGVQEPLAELPVAVPSSAFARNPPWPATLDVVPTTTSRAAITLQLPWRPYHRVPNTLYPAVCPFHSSMNPGRHVPEFGKLSGAIVVLRNLVVQSGLPVSAVAVGKAFGGGRCSWPLPSPFAYAARWPV